VSLMFTDKQIEFMRNIGLYLDFSNLSGDDYVLIEDKVGDIYNSAVLDAEDGTKDRLEVMPTILMCEEILYSSAIQG